jgi:hypothetical protein
MDKAVLLAELQKRLKVLLAKKPKADAKAKRELERFTKHVAKVLMSAGRRLLSGKLKLAESRNRIIPDEVYEELGEFPDGTRALDYDIATYQAAIIQVEHARMKWVKVTTNQMTRWLGAEK